MRSQHVPAFCDEPGESARDLLRWNLKMLSPLFGLVLLGCGVSSAEKSTPPRVRTDPAQAKRVLLVINDASSESREIGDFYKSQRLIPGENVLRVTTATGEEMSRDAFEEAVAKPLKAKLDATKNPIDFIVLTKGMPLRIREGGFAVDAFVACVNKPLEPISNPTETDIRRCLNPYFNKNESFSSKKFGIYLVTRLDGYTVRDAKNLVLNAGSAKPHRGPFLFDADPTRTSNGYKIMQDSLLRAADVLKTKGYDVSLDQSAKFVSHEKPVAGYSSWGSNDRQFDAAAYKGIRFLPGAVGETFVSTSGRTFLPTSGGQSLVADLIAGGISGVKGYVSEPYTFALAKPDILFDRYTSGFNLAESFSMASMVLKWKDVVIGDPLCAPYKK